MADCKACGAWFSSAAPQDLCPACERALNRLNGYAVPVVRCRECKYGRKCGDEISCYHPEYALREGVWSYEEDFYCKYGAPKEGADNG